MKVCPRCGAVFRRGRWQARGRKSTSKRDRGRVEEVLCPGCLRLERGIVEGVVHLEGGFLWHHDQEVRNLIKRVADNRRRRNVAARIASLEEGTEGWTIQTTDHSLAERMGKELERAFSGELHMSWQRKDQFVRVNWKRD